MLTIQNATQYVQKAFPGFIFADGELETDGGMTIALFDELDSHGRETGAQAVVWETPDGLYGEL